MSKTPAGIIVPTHVAYDLEIKIFFNTKNGNTELQLRSISLKEFNTLQIAGVLSEHATSLLRGLVSGNLKTTPVMEEGKPNGKPA